MERAARARSLPHVEASARLGDRELDQQMVDLGLLAVVSGACLAVTGPTTPSFRLFIALPGWPVAYGLLLVACGVGLLVCRTRDAGLHLGQWSLAMLGLVHAVGAAVIVATWSVWKFGSHEGSEPLITLAAGLAYVAVRCGRVWWANVMRTRRGVGPACSR